MWIDDPAKWPVLADRLRAAGEFGIDTETYGQPDKTSPQHRAKVHCWSVGLLTNQRSPRGYSKAVGVVLPAAALECAELLAVLADPSVRKWAHNAPHDYHSLRNMGVGIEGLEDTLQWARVALPGMLDYGLKGMERWALGKPERDTFLQVVTHPVEVVRVTTRKERRCVCGKVPCRARSTSEWWDQKLGWFRLHEREDVVIPTEHKRMVDVRWDVTDFVPGHERWLQWLAYSLADAVSGIEIVSYLRSRKPAKVRYPWNSPSSSASTRSPASTASA